MSNSITDNTKSTVYIINGEGDMSRLGSGVIIDSTHILTVRHLLQDNDAPNDFTIHTYDEQEIKAKVLAVPKDSSVDLAILELERPIENVPSTIFSCDVPKVGESVYAIGNPNGFPWMISFGDVSIVDLKDFVKEQLGSSVFVVNIDAFHGNSGGPLFDRVGGFVVGIVSAIQYWQDEYGIHPAPVTFVQTPTNICYFINSNNIKFKQKIF